MTSLQSTSTLPFADHVRTALEPHFKPFTSCALYAPPIALAQSLLTARESHDPHLIRTCLLAQGWQSTSMVSSPYLEQAELLLCACTGAPAVRSWSAGAGPLQTRWVVLARSWIGRDEFFTSDNDQGVFAHLRLVDFLLVRLQLCTSAGLLIDIACAAPLVVCVCAS